MVVCFSVTRTVERGAEFRFGVSSEVFQQLILAISINGQRPQVDLQHGKKRQPSIGRPRQRINSAVPSKTIRFYRLFSDKQEATAKIIAKPVTSSTSMVLPSYGVLTTTLASAPRAENSNKAYKYIEMIVRTEMLERDLQMSFITRFIVRVGEGFSSTATRSWNAHPAGNFHRY